MIFVCRYDILDREMCPSKLKNFDEVNLQIQENGKFDKKTRQSEWRYALALNVNKPSRIFRQVRF